jgi:hypothetical protein
VVHLLHRVLADVADREVTAGAVEREAPRVAQAIGPDLVAERVVRRDGVRGAGREARIDAQDLAEQRGRGDGVVGGVVIAVATIARRDVQVAVGPELELAAVVVVRLVVLDHEHAAQRERVDRVAGGCAELGYLEVVAGGFVGEEDVQEPAGLEVGRERHREETFLVPGGHDRTRQVGEDRRASVTDDADDPRLFHDVEALAVARRTRHVDR